MQMLEPTYLRYVYDGLLKGSFSSNNASALPHGFIGLFEEEFFPASMPSNDRNKLLKRLALWALFKGSVSTEMASNILAEDINDSKTLIDRYSKWFNTPEPGKYILYHDRLKTYLLQKLSDHEVQELNEALIIFLVAALEQNDSSEAQLYALDHLSTHMAVESELNNNYERLHNYVNREDIWRRQVKASKEYKWSQKGVQFAIKEGARRHHEMNTLTATVNSVKLMQEDQMDIDMILYLFRNGDYLIALERLESWPADRRFIIQILMLIELNLGELKNESYRLHLSKLILIAINKENVSIIITTYYSFEILYLLHSSLIEYGMESYFNIIWEKYDCFFDDEFSEFLLLDFDILEYFKNKIEVKQHKNIINLNRQLIEKENLITEHKSLIKKLFEKLETPQTTRNKSAILKEIEYKEIEINEDDKIINDIELKINYVNKITENLITLDLIYQQFNIKEFNIEVLIEVLKANRGKVCFVTSSFFLLKYYFKESANKKFYVVNEREISFFYDYIINLTLNNILISKSEEKNLLLENRIEFNKILVNESLKRKTYFELNENWYFVEIEINIDLILDENVLNENNIFKKLDIINDISNKIKDDYHSNSSNRLFNYLINIIKDRKINHNSMLTVYSVICNICINLKLHNSALEYLELSLLHAKELMINYYDELKIEQNEYLNENFGNKNRYIELISKNISLLAFSIENNDEILIEKLIKSLDVFINNLILLFFVNLNPFDDTNFIKVLSNDIFELNKKNRNYFSKKFLLELSKLFIHKDSNPIGKSLFLLNLFEKIALQFAINKDFDSLEIILKNIYDEGDIFNALLKKNNVGCENYYIENCINSVLAELLNSESFSQAFLISKRFYDSEKTLLFYADLLRLNLTNNLRNVIIDEFIILNDEVKNIDKKIRIFLNFIGTLNKNELNEKLFLHIQKYAIETKDTDVIQIIIDKKIELNLLENLPNLLKHFHELIDDKIYYNNWLYSTNKIKKYYLLFCASKVLENNNIDGPIAADIFDKLDKLIKLYSLEFEALFFKNVVICNPIDNYSFSFVAAFLDNNHEYESVLEFYQIYEQEEYPNQNLWSSVFDIMDKLGMESSVKKNMKSVPYFGLSNIWNIYCSFLSARAGELEIAQNFISKIKFTNAKDSAYYYVFIALLDQNQIQEALIVRNKIENNYFNCLCLIHEYVFYYNSANKVFKKKCIDNFFIIVESIKEDWKKSSICLSAYKILINNNIIDQKKVLREYLCNQSYILVADLYDSKWYLNNGDSEKAIDIYNRVKEKIYKIDDSKLDSNINFEFQQLEKHILNKNNEESYDFDYLSEKGILQYIDGICDFLIRIRYLNKTNDFQKLLEYFNEFKNNIYWTEGKTDVIHYNIVMAEIQFGLNNVKECKRHLIKLLLITNDESDYVFNR